MHPGDGRAEGRGRTRREYLKYVFATGVSTSLVGYVGDSVASTYSSIVKNSSGDSVTVVWTNHSHGSSVTDMCIVGDEDYLAAGSEDPTDPFKLHLTDDGGVIWSRDESHPSYAVAGDGNTVYYSGGSWSTTVKAFDLKGTELWTRPHDSYIYSLTADDAGRIYVGEDDGQVTKRDVTSGGAVSWTAQTNQSSYSPVYDVAVGPDGDVYVALGDDTVRKMDASDGTTLWTYSGHRDAVRGVATDSNRNVYTASDDGTIHKLNSRGNIAWTFTGHLNGVNDIRVSSGNIYSAADDNSVRKIDRNGNEIWRHTGYSSNVLGVTVDSKGYVYTATAEDRSKDVDAVIKKLRQRE